MSKKNQKKTENIVKRPPIVVVMGHIDHGKSTLLDTIRKSNIVEKETGGITQHISAYTVNHTSKENNTQSNITFLDTPGHAAFQKMRLRGADVADMAILVVSAEDGVKPQTLEALESIKQADIPYIVAINKIDKPGVDIQKTKNSLIENEIYIEGMGGNIPWVTISAKKNIGIDELLDLVILTAEISELQGDTNAYATGKIIESKLDNRRGNTATLIITNGTLHAGQVVVSDDTYCPVRIMESFTGKSVKQAGLSEPVLLIGFNKSPKIGSIFITVDNKKQALQAINKNSKPKDYNDIAYKNTSYNLAEDKNSIPISIKTDVLGTVDAIKHELSKINNDKIHVKIVNSSVGDITAKDVQYLGPNKNGIIVGFNVKTDSTAESLAERFSVEIKTFNIIYELAEWLSEALEKRVPKHKEEIVTGKAKILRYFSTQKNVHVLGAKIDNGVIKTNQKVRIIRRDLEIGHGLVKNLQQQKLDVDQVSDGEFGIKLETKTELATGDLLEAIEII